MQDRQANVAAARWWYKTKFVPMKADRSMSETEGRRRAQRRAMSIARFLGRNADWRAIGWIRGRMPRVRIRLARTTMYEGTHLGKGACTFKG